MQVYVVMGNDYPDCVFEDEQEAEAYCDARRASRQPNAAMVYWRVYQFPLIKRGKKKP